MNIIQLQDRLKGMPTEVIIQNLQSPTGAVPTYLLAGELSRRQKMEAEAAAEMPSDTVTEQLVEESMPQQNLGAMAPQSMAPQPVPPEQAMAAPGVAGLPAPNVGQNYAGGGIVSFVDGGGVQGNQSDLADVGGDIAIEAALLKLFGAPGLALTPTELESGTLYDDEEFAARLAEQQTRNEVAAEEGLSNNEKALLGAGVVGTAASTKKGQQGIKSILKKIPGAKKVTKMPKLLQSFKEQGQKGLDKLKELTKSQPKATPKKGPGRPKKQQPVAPGGGKIDDLLTSGLAAGVKYGGRGAGALYRGAKANPITTGLVGLGGLAMYNSAQEAATEKAREELAKETKKEFDNLKQAREQKEYIAAQQAYLDDLQAKKDKQKQRELFLALALGGAKTMQGESPYALQNVGAGLETGVSAMSAFDIARAEREAELSKKGADLDFEYLKMAQGAEEKYRDQMINILDSNDYQAYKQDLQLQVDDGDISQADMALNLENYIINRIGMPPSIRQATVGNKQFTQI
jgi:hypothetical protein